MRTRERIDPSQLDIKDTVVSINRVTKVVKGGKNLSFSALVVVGDGHGVVVAVKRQHVPPEEDLAVEVLLERLHDRVAWTGELGGDLVGELELRSQGVSISFTAALTRLPSARPLT